MNPRSKEPLSPEKAEWFRSMFACPNCFSEKIDYKLCEFHQEGKQLLGVGTA